MAERQGEVLGLDAAFGTLEEVCAKQGSDWEENLDQRAIEVARMREKGLPLPEWMGKDMANSPADAAEAIQKPTAQ